MYKDDHEYHGDLQAANLEVSCDECKDPFITPTMGLSTCRYPSCNKFFCHSTCARKHMSRCGHSRELITSQQMLFQLADPVPYHRESSYYYGDESYRRAFSEYRDSYPTARNEPRHLRRRERCQATIQKDQVNGSVIGKIPDITLHPEADTLLRIIKNRGPEYRVRHGAPITGRPVAGTNDKTAPSILHSCTINSRTLFRSWNYYNMCIANYFTHVFGQYSGLPPHITETGTV
jgi:hypothetical protein